MAKVIIHAHACQFMNGSMAYWPFNAPIAKRVVEAKNIEEVAADMGKLALDVEKAHPGQSFFVSAMMQRGERQLRNFKKLARLDIDRGSELEPLAMAA